MADTGMVLAEPFGYAIRAPRGGRSDPRQEGLEEIKADGAEPQGSPPVLAHHLTEVPLQFRKEARLDKGDVVGGPPVDPGQILALLPKDDIAHDDLKRLLAAVALAGVEAAEGLRDRSLRVEPCAFGRVLVGVRKRLLGLVLQASAALEELAVVVDGLVEGNAVDICALLAARRIVFDPPGGVLDGGVVDDDTVIDARKAGVGACRLDEGGEHGQEGLDLIVGVNKNKIAQIV